MLKILVTGASGFVASNWIAYCKAHTGFQIQLFNRHQTISDADFDKAIGDADIVIHFAGKAHDLKSKSVYEEYYAANLLLTRKMYDGFLRSSAKKFIFLSSVKAVADKVTGSLTENAVPDPKTDYGKTKLLAENYIQSISLPAGKSFYILRPCMIHGPHNKGNLNLLFKFFKSNIPWPLGAFHNKRSFCSVENLCFVIEQIISRDDIPQAVYNVADDEPLSTSELVRIMGETVGKKTRILAIPVPLIRFAAKIGDIFRLPINSESLDKLTESYVVDNHNIKQKLGKPLPLSTREGMVKTILSFNQ